MFLAFCPLFSNTYMTLCHPSPLFQNIPHKPRKLEKFANLSVLFANGGQLWKAGIFFG